MEIIAHFNFDSFDSFDEDEKRFISNDGNCFTMDDLNELVTHIVCNERLACEYGLTEEEIDLYYMDPLDSNYIMIDIMSEWFKTYKNYGSKETGTLSDDSEFINWHNLCAKIMGLPYHYHKTDD